MCVNTASNLRSPCIIENLNGQLAVQHRMATYKWLGRPEAGARAP
ncbi:predicted protein [Plenodomus lingam JN3]|uniref:Predicted protein n=1 Tax=Leptosphaeria maculans (strain JN3 / isolate v23.1.3 / race Av1-4-5-6-7-8) TaxID=985895 RepID=E4ZZE4_LEPMJ|nr:predicted protein [Plenodomus lingam JN3]CBX96739.1 predicted protein [Plenodomus lingam JN3]